MKSADEIKEKMEAIQRALDVETNVFEYIYGRAQYSILKWVLRSEK